MNSKPKQIDIRIDTDGSSPNNAGKGKPHGNDRVTCAGCAIGCAAMAGFIIGVLLQSVPCAVWSFLIGCLAVAVFAAHGAAKMTEDGTKAPPPPHFGDPSPF